MLQSFGANVVARGGSATVLPAAQLEAARISVPGDFRPRPFSSSPPASARASPS